MPSSVHFTDFTGMVHNKNISLWQEGGLASPGVENVAEVGNANVLLRFADSSIIAKNATAPIIIPAPAPTGSFSRNVYCNSNFSRVSFMSMIAPSPDWFAGINSLELYKNGQWSSDTLVQLYVYDAGTEDGDVFGYNNPATVPQQPIRLLTPATGSVLANGNAVLAAIAVVRISRQ